MFVACEWGFVISFLVSASCVLCHYLFWHAQFKSTLWSIDLDVNIEGVHLEGEIIDIIDVNYTLPDIQAHSRLKEYSFGHSLDLLREQNAAAAAMFLELFSGFWPHVKVLSIHLLWYFPNVPKARSNALYWLEFFGRWSALDVFLMLYLICVLNVGFDGPTSQLINNTAVNVPVWIDSLNGTSFVDDMCWGLWHWHHIKYSQIETCKEIAAFFLIDPEV